MGSAEASCERGRVAGPQRTRLHQRHTGKKMDVTVESTKNEAGKGGATLAEIMSATGWQASFENLSL